MPTAALSEKKFPLDESILNFEKTIIRQKKSDLDPLKEAISQIENSKEMINLMLDTPVSPLQIRYLNNTLQNLIGVSATLNKNIS